MDATAVTPLWLARKRVAEIQSGVTAAALHGSDAFVPAIQDLLLSQDRDSFGAVRVRRGG